MPSVGTITGTLRLVDVFSGPLAVANANLMKTGNAMERTGVRMSRMGQFITTGFSLPLAAASGAAFVFASDFQESMTKVETLSGASRAQVQGWRDDLLSLAAEAGRSPKELADALFFLSSAGIESSKVMGVLETSAKAAAVGLGNTEEIAATTATILNAYTDLEAADVINTIALAVRTGTADTEDFAGTMGRLTGLASALGISFDHLAGVFSAMSLTNADMNENATSLVQIMSSLLGTGDQASKVLDGLGLDFAALRDIAAGPEGLIGVMRTLNEQLSLEDLKKVEPNIRAMRGFLNLLSQDASEVDAVLAEVASGADVLGAAFARVAQDPGFRFKQLLRELHTTLIDAGSSEAFGSLFDSIKFLAEGIGLLVKAFGMLPEPVRNATVFLIAFGAALGPVMAIIGRLATVFGGAARGTMALVTAFLTTTKVGKGMVSTFKNAGRAGMTLGQRLAHAAHFALLFSKNMIQKLLPTLATGPWIALAAAIGVVVFAVQKYIDWMNKAFETTTSNVSQLDKYGTALNGLREAVGNFRKGQELNTEAVLKAGSVYAELGTKIDNAEKKLDRIAKTSGVNSTAYAEQWDHVNSLKVIYQQMGGFLNEVGNEYARLTTAVEENTKAVGLSEEEWERWFEIVKDLQTPQENYNDRLAEMTMLANKGAASGAKLADMISRLNKEMLPIPDKLEKINTALERWANQNIDMGSGMHELMTDLTRIEELYEGTLTLAEKQAIEEAEILALAEKYGLSKEFVDRILSSIRQKYSDIEESGERILTASQMWGEALMEGLRGAGEAAAGLISDAIMDSLTPEQYRTAGEKVGIAIGEGAGSAIGGYFLGPIGEELGGAVGAWLGGAIGRAFDSPSLKEKIKRVFDNFDAGTASVNQTIKAIGLLERAITKLSSGKATRLLAEHFDDVLEAAKRLGGEAVDALAKLADKIRETGVGADILREKLREVMDEAAQVLKDKQDFIIGRVEAIIAGIEKMGLGSAKQVKLAADAVASSFALMLKNGIPLSEIFDKLGSTIEKLKAKGKELGVELGPEFERFGKMMEVLADKQIQGVITKLEGTAEVVKNLGDLNLATQEQFSALARQIDGAFNKLIENGLTANEAYAALAPQFQILNDLQEMYGFQLSENNQALLDQAKALGFVTAKGLTTEDILIKGFDRMLEALNRIIVALGGVPVAMDDWGASIDKTAGKWGEFADGVHNDINGLNEAIRGAGNNLSELIPGGNPGRGNRGGAIPAFSTGSPMLDHGSGRLAMLHGQEQVTTLGQAESIQQMVIDGMMAALSTAGGNDAIGQTQIDLLMRALRQRDMQLEKLDSIDKAVKSDKPRPFVAPSRAA